MVMCIAPGCKHYNQRDTCRFFRIPANPKVQKIWIRNIRRDDIQISKNHVICQCHFKDGLKENGPTLFEHNKNKIFNFQSPEKASKKRNISANPSVSAVPLPSTVPQSFAAAADIQTLLQEIANLKEENLKLKEENLSLKNALAEQELLKKKPFGFYSIESNNDHIMHYTGLPNKEIFNIIFSNCDKVLDKYYEEWNVTCLDRKDQLLVTLMKLKLNPTHTDLGVRFQVSEGTITNVFLTWLYCLHEVLYNCLMAIVPTQVKNELCLPSCFMNFRNCRMVIDCTDFCVQRPKKMSHQRLFYSSYKHRHTMKALIGVAPNGVITYTSEMYPGSTSDKELFKNCNVNNVFQPGDLVVADKGFLISDVVPDGVAVNIPPFLSASQFTPIQINSTKKIARARIHVERAIKRIKVFKITKMLPKSLFPHSSKILQVCVALTNFQPPLLKEVQHLYNIKP